MRVLLVEPEYNLKYGAYGYQAGLAALSASAKRAGFDDIRVLHLSGRYDPAPYERALRVYQPDVVGFYTTFQQDRYLRRLAAATPDSIVTLAGGPHATTVHTCLEDTPGLQGVVIGEGDETFVEILRCLAEGRDWRQTPGTRSRTADGIRNNPPRAFLADLDSLPFEDREPFESARRPRSGLLSISHRNSFRVGRGCPFRCTFCTTPSMSDRQSGNSVRFRSADHIIEEVRRVRERFGTDRVFFQDDTFHVNRALTDELIERWPEEVGLPFEFLGRVDMVEKDLYERMARAGATRVSFGVESGDEELRREVLGKSFTNEQVRRAFQIARDAGMTTEAYLMAGFPRESRASLARTRNLLRDLAPDLYVVAVYLPTPGTRLFAEHHAEELTAPNELPTQAVARRSELLRLHALRRGEVERAVRRWPWAVYGRRSPVKALLFWAFETRFGDVLLHAAGPMRAAIRTWVIRAGRPRSRRLAASSP